MRRNYWLLLLTLCAFMLCAAVSLAAPLTGKATVNAAAVAGIRVAAYPADVIGFGTPPHLSAATAADGLFALDLPPGQYYLLASGGNLAAYYGRNPLSVPAEGLENVNLLMTPDDLAPPAGPAAVQTGVAGLVSHNGQPLAGAVVTVYADLTSQLKGFGMGMAAPTDDRGYFELPLSPGTYYLVVRVRRGGQMAGPLTAGDLFGYLPGNPVVVREEQMARVHIPVIEVPEKVERMADHLFGNTQVSGRIVDLKGRPVAGIQVLLYDDSAMLNRPLYVSRKTGEDGSYQLSFPKGGKYFLAARNSLGGTPAPGELYGRFQGSADHSIEIETGKALENIEIAVEEVF